MDFTETKLKLIALLATTNEAAVLQRIMAVLENAPEDIESIAMVEEPINDNHYTEINLDNDAKKNSFKLGLILMLIELKNNQVLKEIQSILQNQDQENNEVVCYSISGDPMTLKAYNEKLLRSEQDIHNGRVTSHEDVMRKYKIGHE